MLEIFKDNRHKFIKFEKGVLQQVNPKNVFGSYIVKNCYNWVKRVLQYNASGAVYIMFRDYDAFKYEIGDVKDFVPYNQDSIVIGNLQDEMILL